MLVQRADGCDKLVPKRFIVPTASSNVLMDGSHETFNWIG